MASSHESTTGSRVDTSTGTSSQTQTQNTQQGSSGTSSGTTTSHQQQVEAASKNSWLMQLPQLSQLVSQSLTEAANMRTPAVVQAQMTDSEKAALATLQQNQGSAQLQALQQQQAALTAKYGNAQNNAAEINSLTSQFYNSQNVQTQKQQLESELNRNLAGQLHQNDLSAVGSHNLASSRAAIQAGIYQRNQAEALSKGYAQIETAETAAARQQAQNVWSQTLQAQQTGLSNQASMAAQQQSLNIQGAQAQLAAGAAERTYNQQALDIQRQNQILQQSQGMTALSSMLPSLQALANLGVSSTGTTTQNAQGSTTGQESSTGYSNTQGASQGTTSSTTNTQTSGRDTSSGSSFSAAGLAGGILGQIASPIANSFGSAVASGGMSGAKNWLSSLL